jgi:hypothetical protein
LERNDQLNEEIQGRAIGEAARRNEAQRVQNDQILATQAANRDATFARMDAQFRSQCQRAQARGRRQLEAQIAAASQDPGAAPEGAPPEEATASPSQEAMNAHVIEEAVEAEMSLHPDAAWQEAVQAGPVETNISGLSLLAAQARYQQALIRDRTWEKVRRILENKEELQKENQRVINMLEPFAKEWNGRQGDVLVLIWDWQQLGIKGAEGSVGHAALAIRETGGAWVIVQSQFPHGPGEDSATLGPNVTIAGPKKLLMEENGRKPDSAFLVTVPDLGALAEDAIADLKKTFWFVAPAYVKDSTNCTSGIVHSLRAGGVQMSSMWANQTLIVPAFPYTPRDLRTALAREAPFNVIHKYKVHHQSGMIDAIDWTR